MLIKGLVIGCVECVSGCSDREYLWVLRGCVRGGIDELVTDQTCLL